MQTRARLAQVAETTSLAVAGVATLATARVRWISEGAGSTLVGSELANTLRNGALVPDWGGWVAAGIYALVALGGLLLASSGFGSPAVAWPRLAGALLVLLTFVVLARAGWFPASRWSHGPVAIVAAASVAIVVSCLQLARSRRSATVGVELDGGPSA